MSAQNCVRAEKADWNNFSLPIRRSTAMLGIYGTKH